MVTKQSKRVIDWRIRTKEKIVASMGGCCQICKYDRCNSALELHHIDPDEKELSFGSIRANPKSIDKIIEELKSVFYFALTATGKYTLDWWFYQSSTRY